MAVIAAIRILLTRMCLREQVSVDMTTAEYLVPFKKLGPSYWISIFRRV